MHIPVYIIQSVRPLVTVHIPVYIIPSVTPLVTIYIIQAVTLLVPLFLYIY